MITINISKAVNKYADLFQYQQDEKSDNPRFKEGFWSMKSEVNNSPEHDAMLELIYQGSEVDQDSAYAFTVEVLEAMKSIIINTDCPQGEEREALEDYGNIQPYSEAPIYTSELVNWISKGSNYAYFDEVVDEHGEYMGKDDAFGSRFLATAAMAYSKAWEEHYFKLLELVLA